MQRKPYPKSSKPHTTHIALRNEASSSPTLGKIKMSQFHDGLQTIYTTLQQCIYAMWYMIYMISYDEMLEKEKAIGKNVLVYSVNIHTG